MSFHISRTPFRVSFFGGGTDYPEWYLENDGCVLSTTIDKYCYISCRYLPPFFDVRHRIVWSHIETVQTIGEILHPAVREGLRHLGFDDSKGMEIHYQADLPARAGMGSSSSFAVGLIHALRDLRGERPTPKELAEAAIDLERNRLKEVGGIQDQVAVASGGLNVIRFRRSGEIEVNPIRLSPERAEELSGNLMLFFTGTSRMSSDLAAQVQANIASRSNELHAMNRQVEEGLTILENGGTLDAFGSLLHRAWETKRRLGDAVTNTEIDRIYQLAIDSGALGGKLLGAGGSGFMLFYVPYDRQDAIRAALRDKLCVPFGFDHTGSIMLHRPPDQDRSTGSAAPAHSRRYA
jgi:D-glycero-alpha-D-manno-heptose-7-phosphate kinase